MLQNLHVKNLALIDEADVELSKGLNILTGETGAGKSIILGSMNLALGEKVPKEMLRDEEETALVELTFEVTNPKTIAKLEALEVTLEDGCVILSRKITNARSVGRINGETVSASRMKEVAALLIDIYGQHEHQSLLNKRKHLEILDEFAKNEIGSLKEELEGEYKAFCGKQKEWDESSIDEEDQKRNLSFLEYEIHEIEAANLMPKEDEALENEYRRFSNGKKIMESVGMAWQLCGGDGENASDMIARAYRELGQVLQYDDKLEQIASILEEVDHLMSDANSEISKYMNDTEFDDAHFYEVEKRLDLLNHLKSKYGNSIELVLTALSNKKEEAEKLRDYDSYRAKLKKELDAAKEKVHTLSVQLSTIRQKEAKRLCEAIRASLAELNFLEVVFEMEFLRSENYSANGFDDCQFMITTNPGEPIRPLVKIASGGEMSRIMLAIKTVMAQSDEIETLIFDEIDTGISGRTAQMVSEKMNLLGDKHQVICITHLPQIAAMADSHYLIEKSVENASTVSRIRKLKDAESVSELARMLGGVEITDRVYDNAREMKEMARKRKQQ